VPALVTKADFTGALSVDSRVGLGSRSSFVGAMAAIDLSIVAPSLKTPQTVVLAVISDAQTPDLVVRTSQYPVLAVYGDGAPADLSLRAWGYTMDGHRMYVLHVGEEGTFVYDFTTGQWSEWITSGYTASWNAHLGLNWGSEEIVVAGDRQNPEVWIVDPDTFVDEGFKPIVREVTAILTHTGSPWRVLDAVRLYASVGDPSATPATIELSYSDDFGVSYEVPADGLVTIDPLDDFQEIEWLSLGAFRAPGRVIRVKDSGGVARIDRATKDER
jgi:hypothetical protein